MVAIDTFRKIVLSFEGVVEKPHFDRTVFKVTNKRIFATLHAKSETANILFSQIDQSVYCDVDKTIIYPVSNKFGLQGWTTFELKKVSVELLSDAILTAYQLVLETTLVQK